MNETYLKREDDSAKAFAEVWDHKARHSLKRHNDRLARGLLTMYPIESIKDCGNPSCIACSEEYNREFKLSAQEKSEMYYNRPEYAWIEMNESL
jgi:hypothetical protein